MPYDFSECCGHYDGLENGLSMPRNGEHIYYLKITGNHKFK